MSTSFSWDPPPLDKKDEELVRAYQKIGRPVDDLPYTEEFNHLVEIAGADRSSDEDKRSIFKRLLTLRKQGRLPRVTSSST